MTKEKETKKEKKETEKQLDFFKRPHSIVTFSQKGMYGVFDEGILRTGGDPSAVLVSLFEGVKTNNRSLIHLSLLRCFLAGVNTHRVAPELFEFTEKENFDYDQSDYPIHPEDNYDDEEEVDPDGYRIEDPEEIKKHLNMLTG